MKNADTLEHYGNIQGFSIRYQFTQREYEILILIAVYGFSNREIAEKCVISEKTVKNHLANIMNKMGIRSTRKLFSLLFNHLLDSHENNSTKHAFGQIYEETRLNLERQLAK